MANLCDNQLWIEHDDSKKMFQLVDNIKNGKFLDSLVPMNKELLESDAWYDWRIENWGCEKDINPEDICSDELDNYEEGELYLDFTSDNYPPIHAMEKAVKLGFKITLRYIENGMRYMGIFNNSYNYCIDF